MLASSKEGDVLAARSVRYGDSAAADLSADDLDIGADIPLGTEDVSDDEHLTRSAEFESMGEDT